VIIPLPLYDGRIGERALIDEDLRAGMRVRIVSEPYFGVLGVVSEVVREPRLIETEARVPVVSVRMADGGTAVVPRANVEIF
jgi:transcription antitermination factor NusG